MNDDSLRKQMMFDSEKKSQGVSYLLWFFLGGFGAHRFYLGQTGTAIVQLLLGLLGWIPLFLGWFALGIWWIVDAFLIPGLVTQQNHKLAERVLGGTYGYGSALSGAEAPHGRNDPARVVDRG